MSWAVGLVGMAQPFEPEEGIDFCMDENRDRKNNKIYFYVKSIELVLVIISIILFILALASNATECTPREMFIFGILGGILVYPMLILLLPINYYKVKTEMFIFNTIASLALFVVGFIIFSSWYEMQTYLMSDAINENNEIFVTYKNATTLKFISGLVVIIAAILYLTEAFITCLDKLRYI